MLTRNLLAATAAVCLVVAPASAQTAQSIRPAAATLGKSAVKRTAVVAPKPAAERPADQSQLIGLPLGLIIAGAVAGAAVLAVAVVTVTKNSSPN